MPIDFYYLPQSPACRAVQMTAEAVGVELNLKLTKLSDGEHLTPEYLKVCIEKFIFKNLIKFGQLGTKCFNSLNELCTGGIGKKFLSFISAITFNRRNKNRKN